MMSFSWLNNLFWLPFTLAALRSSVRNVPVTHMTAISGEPTYLPCDISTNDDEDSVVLVLWYREDLGTPIYSVDARDRDFSVAERWSDDSVFGSRAYFLPERKPAELGVDRVKATDQGLYRCRVDFRRAQTRNSKINLTVVVPPQKIVISDSVGERKQAVIGPYLEGDSFILNCDVYGGNPRPWVKWFRDDVEVDTTSSILKDGAVRGVLSVQNLARSDVRRTVTCRAANHARTQPIEATLMIEMNFPPVSVHILGSNQPLSAGRRYDLLCQSSGSRPTASITWWKNGKRLMNAKETLSSDGNTTTSAISFVAYKHDVGARLACRAHNPAMALTTPLEDGWTLDVQYAPEPSVHLGKNLDISNIREGSDVYFDCIIKAHPNVYRTEWRHNGAVLHHNIAKGVIISNQSLVLQSVDRRSSGNFTCVGFNAQGEGESPHFRLNVLFAPRCSPGTDYQVAGVAKQEKANVTCHVDANPTDLQFRWIFNNTSNNMEVGPGHVAKSGTSSTVTYTPLTEMDYGTLLCWAVNKIGPQKTPCVFHITPAGKPDPLQNCSIVNTSLSSFGVKCVEGFNGGVTQQFLLEVKDLTTMEVISNITSPVARFIAVGLTPGRTYICNVRAFNSKGFSESSLLKTTTLRPPEKRHTLDQQSDRARSIFPLMSTLPIAIGIGAASVLLCILMAVIWRQRKFKNKPREMSAQPNPTDEAVAGEKIWQEDGDERNPDIIPTENDRMEIEYIRRRQQVSTISPMRTGTASRVNRSVPDGDDCIYRGSIAGLRGYTTLRPQRGTSYHHVSAANIPPPPRFASNHCTLPRNGNFTPNCIPHVQQSIQESIPRSSTANDNSSFTQIIVSQEMARMSFPPALDELRPHRGSIDRQPYAFVRKDSINSCSRTCNPEVINAIAMQSLRSTPVNGSPQALARKLEQHPSPCGDTTL